MLPFKPWVPSLNGQALPACFPLVDFQVEDAIPSSLEERDRPWAFSTLKEELELTPAHVEVMWESILAIWRLKLSEGREVIVPLWQDHVLAWMVRHCFCYRARVRRVGADRK
jgi:hypothetical protein